MTYYVSHMWNILDMKGFWHSTETVWLLRDLIDTTCRECHRTCCMLHVVAYCVRHIAYYILHITYYILHIIYYILHSTDSILHIKYYIRETYHIRMASVIQRKRLHITYSSLLLVKVFELVFWRCGVVNMSCFSRMSCCSQLLLVLWECSGAVLILCCGVVNMHGGSGIDERFYSTSNGHESIGTTVTIIIMFWCSKYVWEEWCIDIYHRWL